jgi:hypothetical protein
MRRVDHIREVLQRRGLRGPVSIQQVVEALRPLAVRPRLAPPEADDSDDPTPELLALSLEERRALGLRDEPIPLRRRFRRAPPLDSIADGRATGVLRVSATAAGPDILRSWVDALSGAWDVAAFQPLLRLRVQALACRNTDGKLSDGSAPQTAQEIGANILEAIEGANEVFASAGIELVFYPAADVEIRNDTKLNQDLVIDPKHPSLWRNPPLSRNELDALAQAHTTQAHRDAISKTYVGRLVVLFAEGTQFVQPQEGWRWCSKCQGLHFGAAGALGPCPAGGQHTTAGSGKYAVALNATGAPGQHQWRWCSKCQGLAFTGHSQGVCAAGGTHATGGSGRYVVTGTSLGLPGQAGWRWCKKCQGLFFSLNDAGACPAGGGHDGSASGGYTLPHGTFPWLLNSPAGFAFSGIDSQFARMTGRVHSPDPGYGPLLAHELGHYLNLAHTHDNTIVLTSDQGADPALTDQKRLDILTKMVRERLDKARLAGTPAAKVADKEFDYDAAHGVSDTAPDIGPQLIDYLNRVTNGGNACGTIGSLTVTLSTAEKVTIAPPRDMVMSYFKGCLNFDLRFSAQQAKRMRAALISGPRRHIVAVQLGDTSTPAERTCAVWNASQQPQVYVWGYTPDDFKKKVGELKAGGMRLRAQQAYTRSGGTRFDGIWNPGSHNEVVVWGWTVADFKAKAAQLHERSMRLVHLESYLLPDGQVRMNAIWNPGAHPQLWFQGWTAADLNPKLSELFGKNFRLAHLNAWTLAGGGVRYDVILNGGSHAQHYILGWTAEDFRKKYDEMWGKGFRLLLLDVHSIGGGLRYDGVWNPSSAPQFVVWGMTREQVRAYYDEMWHQGMRLASMSTARLQ